MRLIVFALFIIIGAHVGFRGNMALGGIIQLFGIWYITRGFWKGFFGNNK
jgi:hypothetical protein